jgi:hypothetical protein
MMSEAVVPTSSWAPVKRAVPVETLYSPGRNETVALVVAPEQTAANQPLTGVEPTLGNEPLHQLLLGLPGEAVQGRPSSRPHEHDEAALVPEAMHRIPSSEVPDPEDFDIHPDATRVVVDGTVTDWLASPVFTVVVTSAQFPPPA